jgi:hypothetical protein
MRAKIGTRVIHAQKDAFIVWDTEIKGFYARRQTKAGRITFGFRYIDAAGKKRETRIGDYPSVTIDDARDAAQIEAGKVAKREDPAAERDAQRAVKTLGEAWADYEKLALHMRKPRVQTHYRGLWTNHLKPRFAAKRVNTFTKADVEGMHKAITDRAAERAAERAAAPKAGYRKGERGSPRRGGKTAANHAVELLSMLLNREDAPNPCAKVERHKSDGKDIRFSDTELGFIIQALDEAPLREQVCFGLFLECANRHQTIASAEWEEFTDLDPRLTNAPPQWLVFGHKLKGGRPQSNYLSRFLADQILKLKTETREASPHYLFPFGEGKRNGAAVAEFDPTRHRVTLDSAWERLKARAIALAEADGVTDLRALRLGTIHTFKHTYLSRFADRGASAIEVQQAGDHADIRTSMRYVKASGERMRALQSEVADRLPRRRAA